MDTYVELDDLISILIEDGFTILGHGTGSNNEVINSIFNKGLRASHTSIYYTTVGLDITNVQALKEKLNNWEHLDSENIILIKLPNRFFNMYGNSSDLECERTYAFVNEYSDINGNITYYLEPKFIVGAYNRNTGLVTMNKNFELVLSDNTIKEMEAKLLKAMAKVWERNQELEKQIAPLKLEPDLLNYKTDTQVDENTTFDDWNWDDEFSDNYHRK